MWIIVESSFSQNWKVFPDMGLSYGKTKCSHLSCIIDPEAKCVPTSTQVQEENIKKGEIFLVIYFTRSLFDLLRSYK